jgi:predicted O-methyltransferase YrrM
VDYITPVRQYANFSRKERNVLTRIDDFFDFLSVNAADRERGLRAAELAGARARGMTNPKDYVALSAIALHYRPNRIFEIGTYLGVTSDFFLSLLPDSRVVSIAYENPQAGLSGPVFNNSELTHEQIGSGVSDERRDRYTQLYGDSHKLDAPSLLKEYGQFDLVLIDGDHSAQGVSMDTTLAQKVLRHAGVICWHDANPKPRYMDVRRFLENELPQMAVATCDDYIGGVAFWSDAIEKRMKLRSASQ